MPLPRKICGELVLLSVLAPLMRSNLAVDYLDSAFASLAKGAIVRAPIKKDVCEELWLDSDRKHLCLLSDQKHPLSSTLTLWNCVGELGLSQKQRIALDLPLPCRWTYRHRVTTISLT